MGLGGRLALPQLADIDQLKDHSESRLMDHVAGKQAIMATLG
jgi:hypothetical protein